MRCAAHHALGCCFVVGFGCGFNHASHADGALTFLCFAKDENLYSLSARADFVFSEYEYKATSQVNSGSINLAWQRGRRVQ